MATVLNLPGPRARSIIERDRDVISASYPRAYPFVMDHGKGSQVWDVDGNRFLDFAAGIAVASTGHSHPAVVKAIQEQAEKFIHISSDFYHEGWVRLGERLDEIAPFSEPAASFMTNSGTESVEAAIKLARYTTGRSQFIGFFGGFHGRTMGAVTFTASKNHYHKGFFPLMNGVTHAPYPDSYRPILASLNGESYGETVVHYIEKEILGKIVPPEEVAGILVEPIQGEGGYIIPEAGFFPALRELCDQHGILLMVDEVQSGMGRTGKWWAIENFGVEPDIVCAAKGIASGVPLGAMIARKRLMSWPKGAHGNTYGGNPLACAVAMEALQVLQDEHMAANADAMGQLLRQQLADLQSPYIGTIRGRGLLNAIVIKHPNPEAAWDLCLALKDRGLLAKPTHGDKIRFAPPLSITADQITECVGIIASALATLDELA